MQLGCACSTGRSFERAFKKPFKFEHLNVAQALQTSLICAVRGAVLRSETPTAQSSTSGQRGQQGRQVMDRKARIMQIAQAQGRIFVDALASEFAVSPHTIRRDINLLCQQSKLRRLHGGAEFVDSSRNVPFDTRAVLNFDPKQVIAARAAALVPDGATVFLSVGSTPMLVAKALAARDRLTVVTNNHNAAMMLAANPSHRIILPGGEMRLPDRDIVSDAAVELFGRYRADFGIYGVGGVDPDGSLLDFHENEVRLRAAIEANSRATILTLDHSKFGRRAAAVGGHIDDADTIVLDRLPDRAFIHVFNDLTAQLLIAQP